MCDGSCLEAFAPTHVCQSTQPPAPLSSTLVPCHPFDVAPSGPGGDGGTCRAPSDCSGSLKCDTSDTTLESCTCDPLSGSNDYKDIGVCKGYCSDETAYLEQQMDDDGVCGPGRPPCSAGLSCRTGEENSDSLASCWIGTCSEETATTSYTSCVEAGYGLCLPDAPEITSVKFSNDGRLLIADLNSKANDAMLDCQYAFDEASASLLAGSGTAWCRVQARKLYIMPGYGSAVAVGEKISLDSEQWQIS